MRFRTTLLLAGVLALLGLAYYFLEIREARKQDETKLVPFQEKEVSTLSIRRGETVITLIREEQGWRMSQPVEDRGDEREIIALLGNVTRARIERTLEAQENIGEFGLQNPAIVFTVQLKDKDQPFTLEVGIAAPAGFSAYARRPGEKKILLVPATVKASLEREPFAFRSKAPLFIDREGVGTVRVSWNSLQLRLERREKNEWWIIHPLEAKADPAKMSDFLRAVTQDQVTTFLDKPPANLGSLGLDPPRGEITFALEAGAETTLLLGTRKKPGGLYARRRGEQQILELKEAFVKGLPQHVADLRDRTLLNFDHGQVARIELESPRGRTLVTKEGDTWKIKEPEEALADQRVVEDLLWDLVRARVKEFVTDNAKTLKPYGLDAPAVTIRLWDKGEKPLTSLALHRADKQEGAYVRVGSGQAVALVEARLFEQLTQGPSDLRLRQLLSFEMWDVGKMGLSRDGQEILLEKQKDRWQLKKPREGKTKYAAVTDLLNDIKNLKWEKVVAREPTDLSRYGLEKPAATVTLTKTDGKPLGTLLLGKTEGDLLYAKTQDHPDIYAVPSTFLKSLPQDPAALLE
ncbi:MAG: DUF4340 domain-containing protein [Candidatus Methylomirabilales bacterium]